MPCADYIIDEYFEERQDYEEINVTRTTCYTTETTLCEALGAPQPLDHDKPPGPSSPSSPTPRTQLCNRKRHKNSSYSEDNHVPTRDDHKRAKYYDNAQESFRKYVKLSQFDKIKSRGQPTLRTSYCFPELDKILTLQRGDSTTPVVLPVETLLGLSNVESSMANKKNKKKSAAAKAQANGNDSGQQPESPTAGPSNPLPASSSPPPQSPSPTAVPEHVEDGEDIVKRAEKVKEKGNTAFKAGRYQEAIEHYTKAIEMNPLDPTFLTNRAASYMSLKRFRPALDDCQQAATLQASAPSPKTLLRLSRCQLALGLATPASSTLKAVLDMEPKNAPAMQLKTKITELETHLRRFEEAKGKKDWGMARLALEKCFQGIDSEGEEIPTEWNTWKIELELSKGNIEGANLAATEALRLSPNSPETLTLRGLVLFINGKIPQATQHVTSALRFDPAYEPAMRLRRRIKDVDRLKTEGNNLFKQQKLQEAVDKYTEALELIGDKEEEGKGGNIRATLLSNRATTLVKMELWEEALKDADISIDLVDTSFKAFRTRARIHLAMEHYDKAVNDFKAAINEAINDGSTTDADVRALKNELKKAEADFKRSKSKDYYKILGLKRDCTELEIKKAYRRESLKHHPDKGGDEEKFKLVVEANAVLSDPARRERYDMGDDEDGMNDGGMGGMGGMSQADIANLFAQFGGGGFGGGGGGFGGGPYGGRHPGGFSFTFG
ncbi:hypothetical protein VNI00_010605 [Paramarasmius palmivorus]|uniref:J domain-containing protein n=1 Tax=Paramarasmius palmivorus TaxID=297713 RepID=A0AAW0CIP7_9AGAR